MFPSSPRAASILASLEMFTGTDLEIKSPLQDSLSTVSNWDTEGAHRVLSPYTEAVSSVKLTLLQTTLGHMAHINSLIFQYMKVHLFENQNFNGHVTPPAHSSSVWKFHDSLIQQKWKRRKIFQDR